MLVRSTRNSGQITADEQPAFLSAPCRGGERRPAQVNLEDDPVDLADRDATSPMKDKTVPRPVGVARLFLAKISSELALLRRRTFEAGEQLN